MDCIFREGGGDGLTIFGGGGKVFSNKLFEENYYEKMDKFIIDNMYNTFNNGLWLGCTG